MGARISSLVYIYWLELEAEHAEALGCICLLQYTSRRYVRTPVTGCVVLLLTSLRSRMTEDNNSCMFW
jgi:hemolysin-activating ACP:hemolysin acyltransferase